MESNLNRSPISNPMALLSYCDFFFGQSVVHFEKDKGYKGDIFIKCLKLIKSLANKLTELILTSNHIQVQSYCYNQLQRNYPKWLYWNSDGSIYIVLIQMQLAIVIGYYYP